MKNNLDLKCAEFGARIAKDFGDDEALVNKSLGVLLEDGVYAYFLYLKSKNHSASEVSFKFLKDPSTLGGFIKADAGNDVFALLCSKFADNLNQLLFAKDLLERMLVYARYHIKAAPKKSKKEG